MPHASSPLRLYTIPPHLDFLEDLAAGILHESSTHQIPLPSYKILLPSRRACQNLRDAFLRLVAGKIILLPQITALGEVAEDDLFFHGGAEITAALALLPPALSPIKRQFLFSRLIRQMEENTGQPPRPLEQTLKLSVALAGFFDQVIIEELSLENLALLVPEEFAAHWQITLDFLDILRHNWPQILAEEGVIEAATRRNKLLDLQAQHWRASPPSTPVIIAGSTGTMPATARLMKIVAGLPQGSVVLPGLDLDLDVKSWHTLEAAHPQSLLRDILEELEATRDDVKLWRGGGAKDQGIAANLPAREILLREMMRPAVTTDHWQTLGVTGEIQDLLRGDLQNINLYECETRTEEAMVIAIALREALETPGQSAAVVTPDRATARQVKLLCARWGIILDDSAGTPLSDTGAGQFLLRSLDVFIDSFSPTSTLALLKSPLCALGRARETAGRDIAALDMALRGPAPKDIFDQAGDHPVLAALQKTCAPYMMFTTDSLQSFDKLLAAHIDLVEDLAATDTDGGDTRLWRGDAGEAAANFLFELRGEAAALGHVTPQDYQQVLQNLLQQQVLRPKYGTHPRLHILGQIEARLMKADVMILSGLNENIWPATADAGPWLSRPMRRAFGLPALERGTALAAHDFSHGFCAPRVILTRTLRQDGAPSVAARWLQRLDIVLQAYGLPTDLLRRGNLQHWAHILDQPAEASIPALRPEPRPNLTRRPRSLPVTAIETWMRDPYSLYAKYVLNLRKLDPVDQDGDAALRGSWLHSVFEWFVRNYPDKLPENSFEILLDFAVQHESVPRDVMLYMPRLKRLLAWFIAQETAWRQIAIPDANALEVNAELMINGLKLRATADRIDHLRENNHAVIIDYKTGRIPTPTDIALGLSPQMPLEGFLLQGGGFQNIPANDIAGLYFWKPGGGLESGHVSSATSKNSPPLPELIEEAAAGLKNLVQHFQDEKVPYYALPDTKCAPPAAWQDYALLARVQEWATLEDVEGG